MKVLITGSAGQLGQALIHSKPSFAEIIPTTRSELDLANENACKQAVQFYKPDWIINCGAYTSVDNAESEPKLVMAINGIAPRAFAEALSETGGKILQLSTDFVFNGEQGFPYKTDQVKSPLGVYGVTKAAGEDAIFQVLKGSQQSIILRTSWVMGSKGDNFLKKMLKLHQSNRELRVVSDQVGCPTTTNSLAKACWKIIERFPSMNLIKMDPLILHWSEAGVASWYDVAEAIGEIGQMLGLIDRSAKVIPIMTHDYPTLAKRPSYSLLDCSSTRKILELEALHWREALSLSLKEIPY